MANPRQRKKLKNPRLKVTRRLANKHAKKLPSVNDSFLKKAWNRHLSTKENFSRLGLTMNVNSDVHKLNQILSGEAMIQKTVNGDMYIEELIKEPEKIISGNNLLNELEKQASYTSSKRKERHLSRNQLKMKEALTATYGQDFEKMARDRRLNPYQMTPNQLRCFLQK